MFSLLKTCDLPTRSWSFGAIDIHLHIFVRNLSGFWITLYTLYVIPKNTLNTVNYVKWVKSFNVIPKLERLLTKYANKYRKLRITLSPNETPNKSCGLGYFLQIMEARLAISWCKPTKARQAHHGQWHGQWHGMAWRGVEMAGRGGHPLRRIRIRFQRIFFYSYFQRNYQLRRARCSEHEYGVRFFEAEWIDLRGSSKFSPPKRVLHSCFVYLLIASNFHQVTSSETNITYFQQRSSVRERSRSNRRKTPSKHGMPQAVLVYRRNLPTYIV